jgi:hypothetical protein
MHRRAEQPPQPGAELRPRKHLKASGHLLGADVPEWVDGRVLWEVFENPHGEPGELSEEVVEPLTSAANGFSPALRLHRVGGVRYLHSGTNGRQGDI